MGILALASAGARAPGQAAPFVIVQEGVPVARLELPARPVPDEELAASELRHFVRLMSDAELPTMEPATGGRRIRLGRAEGFGELPFPAALEPEQYLITVVDDILYVIGGSGRGALWGVYGLLHELGCRWYMPGPIGEVVPRRSTVSVAGARRIDGPDFHYRQIWYSWGGPPDGGARFAEWARRNRLAHPDVRHGHNLTASMPAEAAFEKRPELYALRGAERSASQVCTTDPEVIRLITQRVNRFFDAYPDCLCYSLCPDDNTDFCECARCRALDSEERTAEGRPIVTDRLVAFVNAVAEGIQERHPGKMVSTYAYVNHSKPPRRTPVSPHVAIFFTTSMYCGGHGIGDARCSSRMEMKSDLSTWSRLCPNLYIYEYDPIPGNAEHVWPLFGARAREMPLYRAMGIRGITVEGHCSWATLSPNHWVSAQCLWDADRTAGELLHDFCEGFFGERAGPEMERFYGELEAALAGHAPMIEWGSRDIPEIFGPRVASSCREALNRARVRAGASTGPHSAVIEERLGVVDLGFLYLESYLTARRLAAADAHADALRAAYEQCLRLIDEMTAASADFIEINSCRPTIRGELGEALGMRHGQELGLVTRWNVIGPFDNAGGAGHDRVYPPETGLALDATCAGLGSTVGWKLIAAPPRQGYVDLLPHFTPKDWVVAYALGFIHSERAVDAELRMGSNDTLKVWLGQELVWHFDQPRRARVDEDVVPVRLPAGVTPVLLKIAQTGRDWGFYLRITDATGRPVADVRTNPRP